MRGIKKYIQPYYAMIALTLLIKFAASMMDLLIPSILAKIIDEIVPLHQPAQIYLWGGIMLLCALISITCNITANRMSAKSAGKITQHIRHDLFVKTSYLSARQMDQFTVSSLNARLTSDTYNLNELFARMQRIGIRGPILLIGGILMTLTMDAALTLVLAAILPLIALVVYIVTKKSIPLYTEQQGVVDRMVRVMQENISGIRVIKALSKTEYEKNRFDGVNHTLADTERRVGAIMATTNPATTLILNLGLTAVVAVGAFRMNAGKTQPGVIIAFLNYFTIILNAMLGITRIFILCSRGIASARRVSEVLQAPEDLAVLPWKEEEREKEPVHIRFSHVDFSYNHVENNLTDINFALKRGETLGILGATGSGKSTILNLLLRFYDVDGGEILIDGRDIRTIPIKQLRQKFGVVFQNDFLVAETIAENISYFRDLPQEQIQKAAQAAQAWNFIAQKSNGLQEQVAVRGNNLSGGQKQRLLIARALAAQPEILILDDASSALDYRTDAALRKALHHHFQGTTSIIVAQRISSIMGADHILVLEEGKIIGYGTHEALLRNCEVYRSISHMQMGTDGEEVQ